MIVHKSIIDKNTCGFLVRIAKNEINLCEDDSALALHRTCKANLLITNFYTYQHEDAVNLAEACSEKFFADFHISDTNKQKQISNIFHGAVEQIELMHCSGMDFFANSNHTF